MSFLAHSTVRTCTAVCAISGRQLSILIDLRIEGVIREYD